MAWAQKGVDALKRAGLPAESLTIIAKEATLVVDRARIGRRPIVSSWSVPVRFWPAAHGKGAPGTGDDLPKLGLSARCAGQVSESRRPDFRHADGPRRVLVAITASRAPPMRSRFSTRMVEAMLISAWTGRVWSPVRVLSQEVTAGPRER
jgi:hypothetical protein